MLINNGFLKKTLEKAINLRNNYEKISNITIERTLNLFTEKIQKVVD